jgi:hypothetical protein
MAIVHASTPAAPLSAKIPQVTGQKKNGKNWHENKAAFRPGTGHTSYAKRTEKQKQEAEVKKMEKEMKDEKEQERQVCFNHFTKDETVSCAYVHEEHLLHLKLCANDVLIILLFAEESPSYQRQARRKGGEGQVCTAGC